MDFILQPWQLYVLVLAGWVNRQQQIVIAYLRTENQVLRESHPNVDVSWNQDCVVGLVIHELAHFILEHETEDDIHEEMRNESEVEETACKWGFEVETTSLKELPELCFR